LVALLEETAMTPRASRQLQVQAQLGGLLRVAAHFVPYYRERLPAWCRDGHFDAAQFRELPILQRADLQEFGAQLENARPPAPYRALGSTSTSGSTGAPIITKGHRAAGMMTRAQQLRFQRRLRFDFDAPCAFLTSPHKPGFADPPEGKVGPPWSAGMGSGPALLLDLMASSDDQLDWLIRQGASYLATYPSNLQALIQRSVELGRQPDALRAIVLSSEPVSPELVALAEQTWGAKCLATYSSSEAGLMGSPRADGEGYYVEAEAVHLEVLRDDGTPCAPGEVGRVVVTTLQEFLRPLIRYEVGDYAEVVQDDLADAITLPRLGRVLGRERTMIQLPDGRRVWPHFEFAPLLALGGLRRWQLVQHADLSMTARVVGNGPMSDVLQARIVDVIQSALPGIQIRIEQVQDIPRTARGKFLELVSEVGTAGEG
jgi:phenylacetate-CoA ligase